MKYLRIETHNPYNIYYAASINSSIPEKIRTYSESKNLIIICDIALKILHLPTLLDALNRLGFTINVLYINPSEEGKSMTTVTTLCEEILTIGIKRNTPIIAFGGGITGDVAGFCASILMRGLPLFQIPSTLLAMSDSAVGGKCGVNSTLGKNMFGSFYNPVAVFIDTSLLKTLPELHYKAGYAECVKYALLFSEKYFHYLEDNYKLFLDKNPEYLDEIIEKSCIYKAKIVKADELEKLNIRYLLNLGHTFAHAIESYDNYKTSVIHGRAVSVGLCLAYKFSAFLSLCKIENYDRIRNHLSTVGLPVTIRELIEHIDTHKLLAIMNRDKKNSHNLITLILANAIGNCFVKDNVDIAILETFLHQEKL